MIARNNICQLSSTEVAFLILEASLEHTSKNGNPLKLTPQMVEKLTYIVHGFFLAEYSQSLLNESVHIDTEAPFFPVLSEKIHELGSLKWLRVEHLGDILPKRDKRVLKFISTIFKTFILDIQTSCSDLDYYTKGLGNDWGFIFKTAEITGDFILPEFVVRMRFYDDLHSSELTSYNVVAYQNYHPKAA